MGFDLLQGLTFGLWEEDNRDEEVDYGETGESKEYGGVAVLAHERQKYASQGCGY